MNGASRLNDSQSRQSNYLLPAYLGSNCPLGAACPANRPRASRKSGASSPICAMCWNRRVARQVGVIQMAVCSVGLFSRQNFDVLRLQGTPAASSFSYTFLLRCLIAS